MSYCIDLSYRFGSFVIPLIALLACFLFYVVLALLWIGLKKAFRNGYFDGCLYALKLKKKRNVNADESVTCKQTEDDKTTKKSSRLKSLDTFRG